MREIDATSRKQYLEIQNQLESARSTLATAERELSLLEVKAPISGVLGRITVRSGETVNTADVLTSISNLHRQIVVADVPVGEISVIARDQRVIVYSTAKADSSHVIEGFVRAIGETVDPVNDTVEVLISLPEVASMRKGEFVKGRHCLYGTYRLSCGAFDECGVRSQWLCNRCGGNKRDGGTEECNGWTSGKTD